MFSYFIVVTGSNASDTGEDVGKSCMGIKDELLFVILPTYGYVVISLPML